MKVFEVGQVWERDGKTREIVSLGMVPSTSTGYTPTSKADSDSLRTVHWRRSPKHSERYCWCSTWLDWTDKATLTKG